MTTSSSKCACAIIHLRWPSNIIPSVERSTTRSSKISLPGSNHRTIEGVESLRKLRGLKARDGGLLQEPAENIQGIPRSTCRRLPMPSFLASYHDKRSVLLGFRARRSRRGPDIEILISSKTILPCFRLLDSPSLRYRLDKRGPTFSEAVSLHH
jgi:hypothetical protein